MSSFRIIGKRISPLNCIPEYITNTIPGLTGGWSEMEDIKEDKMKITRWIEEALHNYHIYYDNNDVITILKVYRQVVAGINYWILFQLTPTGDLFWMQVFEPLTHTNEAPIIQNLAACS
jgi:hypothetical protein